MSRDLTKAQFAAKCKKLGFTPTGVMGYYILPDAPSTHVSILNAGPRRRAQLAYLIKQNALAAGTAEFAKDPR